MALTFEKMFIILLTFPISDIKREILINIPAGHISYIYNADQKGSLIGWQINWIAFFIRALGNMTRIVRQVAVRSVLAHSWQENLWNFRMVAIIGNERLYDWSFLVPTTHLNLFVSVWYLLAIMSRNIGSVNHLRLRALTTQPKNDWSISDWSSTSRAGWRDTVSLRSCLQ